MSASTALTLEQAWLIWPQSSARSISIVRGNKVVVAPADIQQIAEVLRFAQCQRARSDAQRRRNKTWLGEPGRGGHRVEHGASQCELREHAWQDMTCTVAGRLLMDDDAGALEQHGQMVALDPLGLTAPRWAESLPQTTAAPCG